MDADDDALTRVAPSPRDFPKEHNLPTVKVQSAPPTDPRRQPTEKLDPYRPPPTAYVSPAATPPQRAVPAGQVPSAVMVRSHADEPPHQPPPNALSQVQYAEEHTGLDTTMKALIALIVVLALALAVVLILLIRR